MTKDKRERERERRGRIKFRKLASSAGGAAISPSLVNCSRKNEREKGRKL